MEPHVTTWRASTPMSHPSTLLSHRPACGGSKKQGQAGKQGYLIKMQSSQGRSANFWLRLEHVQATTGSHCISAKTEICSRRDVFAHAGHRRPCNRCEAAIVDTAQQLLGLVLLGSGAEGFGVACSLSPRSGRWRECRWPHRPTHPHTYAARHAPTRLTPAHTHRMRNANAPIAHSGPPRRI
jgi:hypothetical protein